MRVFRASVLRLLGTFIGIFRVMVVPIMIYTARHFYPQTPRLGTTWHINVLIVTLGGVGVVAFIVALGYRIGVARGSWAKQNIKTPVAVAMICVASLIAFLLPVPLTPEQEYFQQHKADYNRIVASARHGQLDSNNTNVLMSTVSVPYENPFTVVFAFSDASTGAVVYTEEQNRLNFIDQCVPKTFTPKSSGHIYVVLDQNWYLCYVDQPK